MINESGPFVQTACFCENILNEKDGAVSLIRIIDTINHSASGTNPPDSMPAFTHPFKLAIMLKSGSARGRHNLLIIPEAPTGAALSEQSFTIHFQGEEHGFNILVNLIFTFEIEGLYWFQVRLDDHLITNIPLRVIYNRVVTTAN